MDAAAVLPASALAAAGADPNRLTLDANGVAMQLVRIPTGEFLMGSPASVERAPDNERPQHKVTIAEPFYLGAYEVTRKQFAARPALRSCATLYRQISRIISSLRLRSGRQVHSIQTGLPHAVSPSARTTRG
jgi:formylglycine-generating enzyme required for sulfatase activity